jgi:hypothetical protein
LGDDTEIPNALARLRDEVRSQAPSRGLEPEEARILRRAARQQAERYWAVSAERPPMGAPGMRGRARALATAPLKLVARRLVRWYVEPALADLRYFNAATLQLLDDLEERTAALEEQQRSPGSAGEDV